MCTELIDRLKVVYKDEIYRDGKLKGRVLKTLLEHVLKEYNTSIRRIEAVSPDGESEDAQKVRARVKRTLANLSERRFNLINYIKGLE